MEAASPDSVRLRRWVAFYSAFLLAVGVPIVWMLGNLGRPWTELFTRPAEFPLASQALLKLLILLAYLSICTTFTPLPTGWLVVGLATRQAALTHSGVATVLLVALVGATGSTLANLNDYHLFTWLLRSHRIAQVRRTRFYRIWSRWFSRAPFSILLIINIVPVPVDVVRVLATVSQYPRLPFTLANWLGRVIRYGVLAGLTYYLHWGIGAVFAMLGIALALALIKALSGPVMRSRRRHRRLTRGKADRAA